MPYWSKGRIGIRKGDYTGPTLFGLDDQRDMVKNLRIANSAASHLGEMGLLDVGVGVCILMYRICVQKPST